jgi:hypothetical protein
MQDLSMVLALLAPRRGDGVSVRHIVRVGHGLANPEHTSAGVDDPNAAFSTSEAQTDALDVLAEAWADLLVADYWVRHGTPAKKATVVAHNSPYTRPDTTPSSPCH